jgi:hypothetical protein
MLHEFRDAAAVDEGLRLNQFEPHRPSSWADTQSHQTSANPQYFCCVIQCHALIFGDTE